jgi:hypothetical protein
VKINPEFLVDGAFAPVAANNEQDHPLGYPQIYGITGLKPDYWFYLQP